LFIVYLAFLLIIVTACISS